MAPVITSDQYAAAQSEMVISWWRDWTRFLTARGTLNTIQRQRMSGTITTVADAFDQTQAKGSAEAQERQATATLDRLPAARRTVFEAELNDRVALLQQAAGTAATEDLTTFIHQALHEFTEQAYGRVTTGKHAFKAAVPCEARAWFGFDPKHIDSLPPEAAWTIARPEQERAPQWQLIGAIASIIVIIAGMVGYSLWPQLFPAKVVIAAAQETILVNEAPITPWPVRAVVIGESATLPVARLDAEAWPAAPSGAVGWRTAAVWPAELCLPATAADPLPAVITLLSVGDGLDRTFALSTDAVARRPDLRLVACGSGKPLATGTLQVSVAPAPFVPGVRHAIPHLGDLTLTNVQVVTSAQNAAIAAGRAQVQIRMAAPAGVDWPAWQPVLRGFDGSTARSATVAEADGTTTLTYDVPTSTLGHAEESLWQITAPSDDGLGAAYRWAFPLALP